MIKRIALIIGILAVVALSGCVGNSLNSSPPDYIKTISAVQDGQGLQIYFILADKSSAMTTSDGKFVLKMTQDGRTIYQSRLVNVTKSDFAQRSVGMGNFAHDVVMDYVGRIAYTDMRSIPKSGMGEVILTFTTPDGRVLDGKETVFF